MFNVQSVCQWKNSKYVLYEDVLAIALQTVVLFSCDDLKKCPNDFLGYT